MGLVAPRHVGSSRTRARTCVPCVSRQILNHCATREVPFVLFWIIAILLGVKWLWFAFTKWLVTLSIFSCSYWPLVYLLWTDIQVFWPFLNCTDFLLLSCRSSLYVRILTFAAKKSLILMKSNLPIDFLFPVLLLSYLRSHCQIHCHETFPCVFF